MSFMYWIKLFPRMFVWLSDQHFPQNLIIDMLNLSQLLFSPSLSLSLSFIYLSLSILWLSLTRTHYHLACCCPEARGKVPSRSLVSPPSPPYAAARPCSKSFSRSPDSFKVTQMYICMIYLHAKLTIRTTSPLSVCSIYIAMGNGVTV